jgi:hypothetical protein
LPIASFVSRRANAGTERAAGIVTWTGDEHVLGAVAAAWWLWAVSLFAVRLQFVNFIAVFNLLNHVMVQCDKHPLPPAFRA